MLQTTAMRFPFDTARAARFVFVEEPRNMDNTNLLEDGCIQHILQIVATSSCVSPSASPSSSPSPSASPSASGSPKRKRRSRSLSSKTWNQRLQELVRFREGHGHCFVPHAYPCNPKLSQWVRKQRHQRKRKEKGLHSTLSDEREEMLTNSGFIWDSHRAQWHERYQLLEAFHFANGHCNVPSNFHVSSLSTWVKNQRKQFKLLESGLSTVMDQERIDLLNSLGFNWNPRGL